jgi:hypothetical protein
MQITALSQAFLDIRDLVRTNRVLTDFRCIMEAGIKWEIRLNIDRVMDERDNSIPTRTIVFEP